MSDRVNRDGIGLDHEQDASVAGAQPHSGDAFERFHIASAGRRERLQFEVDLRARRGRKFAPLANGRRSEVDLFHFPNIA
ncbi:hypothetical protein [Bradyrhizobium sp.]|uniref:hypothetical protein n=1 Tax=Bradyrhizobium sp. TaxID=376 RepID=UPI003C74B02E